MRIVAGKNRGKSLTTPADQSIRPTGDRIRESLFNILTSHLSTGDGEPFAGIAVLDAFAGTGALGLEALSRGAARATFMEKDPGAQRLCQANIRHLGETDNSKLVRCDVRHPPPADGACQLAILDPPYHQDLVEPALAALAEKGWIDDGALVVVELPSREASPKLEGFTPWDRREYGTTALQFWRYQSLSDP